MKMSAQVLECFLESCPFLEKLRVRCVVFSSGSIRASCSLMSLKHLEVCNSQLEIIDILSPKLLTFIYHGCNIQLNIRNASSLSDVSVGNFYQHPAYAFDSFSEYFPQLEYLHLRAYLESGKNSVISSVSNLTNLKHLKLTINAFPCQSLLGWMTLIEASPVLHKLTLELSPIYDGSDAVILQLSPIYDGSETRFGKRTSPRPLESLRTLEVYGFVGLQIDIELVIYVFGNAMFLEKAVIVLKGDCHIYTSRSKVARAEAMELKKKLPLTTWCRTFH